ncbi:MAG: tRNA (adenosine(37)-N6)-dimethylallyltransferase MiaA [Lachnospiraceae bacterium]|jgi:tRNA dimethylallyltransferase
MMPESDNKNKMIVIEGPTAVGKSDIAVLAAKKLHTEVVSADSIQVYKGLDIGSGKITPGEMMGIRHHMIDIKEPEDEYDIAEFINDAGNCIRDINERGMIPIVAGGTGFYLQALVRDIDFSQGSPVTDYREELALIAREKGNEYLHDMLRKVDPESARTIHPNNLKRVIRGLEYYKTTGKKISDKNDEDKHKKSPYDVLTFFIDMDRAALYDRINLRVDKMLESGLVEEVASLKERGLDRAGLTSMQGLGYKEILMYLNREVSFEEAVLLLKKRTRRFAKRQLTWFSHNDYDYHFMRENFEDNNEIAEKICSLCREHFGI